MGIGGSFQDDSTEDEEEDKRTTIVHENTCDKDCTRFRSTIDHPRALSNMSKSQCCCQRVRKLSNFEDDVCNNISQEGEDRCQRVKSVEIGARVHVRNYGLGTVRFNGEAHFAPGFFIGVELDKPFGKHDGFYDGKRYFHARPKTGVFVRQRRLGLARDNVKAHDSKKQLQRRKCSFVLTLNGGLVTIQTSLKRNVKNGDCQIIRYRSNRLSTDFDETKQEVSLSALEDQFMSLNSNDDKESKLDLLRQLLDKEYLQLYPNKKLGSSHLQTRAPRKDYSLSLETNEQLAYHPEEDSYSPLKSNTREHPTSIVPTPVLQQTSELSLAAPSVICLTQTSVSVRTLSFPAEANSKSSLSLTSQNDVEELPCKQDLKPSTSGTHPSFDYNDNNWNSSSRVRMRVEPYKICIDPGSTKDLESDYYTDYSEDDVCQVDLLTEDLKHERLIVKRKEDRVRELEEELRGYDRELKEKIKALRNNSKRIESLESQCEKLSAGMDKALEDAKAWQFEVLYGRGEHTMISLDV